MSDPPSESDPRSSRSAARADAPASRGWESDDDYGATPVREPEPAQVVEALLEETTEPQPQPVMGGRLRGRVAIVTGGSSGIGRATCLELAGLGVDIAFNFLDEGPESRREAQDVLRQLRELEVRALCRSADVTDPGEVSEFVRACLEELGGLHILVNNAGIGRDRALWRMTDEQWTSVLRTNLDGAFYCTRAVAPHMRTQEFGKIVNVASVHAFTGEFGVSNYSASKAGLVGLTRAAAAELGTRNINVNAVAPGFIRTTRLTDGVPAEILDAARERSALGRLGDPQDVARVIVFLCSEAARHLTGVVIPVDGGYLV